MIQFNRLVLVVLCATSSLFAEVDSSRVVHATTQDAIYQRPFVGNLSSTTTFGGYADFNAMTRHEDGVSEGLSFEMRRWNLFVYSAISSRMKMLAEVEFEHGTDEISLETAQLDYVVNSGLVIRAGIMLAPIGAFNQRHDSPLYEFMDRPLVATDIIPSTLSLAGLGVNGKFFPTTKLVLTYDVCLSNGLHEGIILNKDQRTTLRNGRSNELFEESSNGVPAVTARVAVRHRDGFELGVSMYEGVYNTFSDEGVAFAEKRHVQIAALDYNVDLGWMVIRGESAMNSIDVPADLRDIYASRQWGSFLEAVVPVMKFEMFDDKAAQIFTALRYDYADRFASTFNNGSAAGDDEQALSVAVTLHPTTTTVVRLNYRRSWINDVLSNPSQLSVISFGYSTYF